jgi:hypothetical protein
MAYSAADLRMVDDHIALGERHVVQQEALISRLRQRGLPTEVAENLLSEFQLLLAQHRAHRTLIAADLEERG